MKITTNRLNIKFNIEALERDFVFIRFERQHKNKWLNAKVLDQLFDQEFKAKSILFEYGKYAYVMFKKPISISLFKLKNKLSAKDEYIFNIKEVVPRTSISTNEDCICGAWLAQILLNSLTSPQTEQFSYCNLTGKLFVISEKPNKKENCLDVAKITINKDYLFQIKTVRFIPLESVKSNKDKSKPRYIFEPTTNTLKRTFDKNSDPKLTYIQKGINNKKASRTFLDFSNLEKFNKSRAGIFCDIMTKIKTNLSEYMEVSLSSREVKKSEDSLAIQSKFVQDEKYMRKQLEGRKIHIVSRIKDQESLDLVELLITKIKEELLAKYVTDENLITEGIRDKKDALNIRIIHNQEYYNKLEIDDEYKNSTADYQRQHITIELSQVQDLNKLDNLEPESKKYQDIEKKLKVITKAIIKEQLIKRDISNGKLDLFDWKQLQAKGDWIFANWVQETIDDQEKDFVIFLTIKPDGSFSFRKIDGQDIFSYQDFDKYMKLMTEYNKKKQKMEKKRGLEGLIQSEDGDINLLFNTDEITIPNLDEIKTILEQLDQPLPKYQNTGNDLAEIIQEFIDENSNNKISQLPAFAKLDQVIEELQEIDDDEIDKNSFRKLLNKHLKGKGSDKIDTALRKYLLEKYKIRLHFSKDFVTNLKSRQLFEALFDIKYYGETKTEAYYSVGVSQNVQSDFKDACHIRKIISVEGSKLIFQELLKTMDVDFVRTGQSTVIPFPFKYIREYQNLNLPN
jgi:hypothetical protein